MFSYLACIKPLVNDSVYATGIKLYLEGNIIEVKDMILPDWKICTVHGNHENYTVIFPLVQKLIPNTTLDKYSEALHQHCVCTCPYFNEYSICKHIVASSAYFDDKLEKKTPAKSTPAQTQKIDSLIDTMFAVEGQKKTRKWIEQVDKYLNRLSPEDCFWFDEIVRDVARNPVEYTGFIRDLEEYVLKHLYSFEYEIKIIELIKHSVYFGEKFWWDFWFPILSHISVEGQIKVWVAVWKLYIAGVLNLWKQDFLYQLRANDPDLNHRILGKLQIDFRGKSEFWTRFVVEAQITGWIEDNVTKLDPINLLKIVTYLPDKQEKIEETIYVQIRVWSDFLTSGSYDQIIEVFQLWKDTLGQTDIFQDAQNYIKIHHSKKRSLLKKIG